MTNGLKSAKILLVEDNPADARPIIDYFNNSEDSIVIKHLEDGAKCLNYLHQKGNYKNDSLPDIIILDMNLPKIEGMKVLEEIKEDDNLRRIPVIIFGTSNDPLEVKKAYTNFANCYVVKPLDFNRFNKIMKCIDEFWLKTVILPFKL